MGNGAPPIQKTPREGLLKGLHHHRRIATLGFAEQ
jgi:hypothetical protein